MFCKKSCSNQSKLEDNIPVIKYSVKREKIKFLHKRDTAAIGKSFIQDKKLKMFFFTPEPKLRKLLTLLKDVYPKKLKKIIREFILRN